MPEPQPIPERMHQPWAALVEAGFSNRLALMSCTDRLTGLPVYVICATLHLEHEVLMAPVGVVPDFDMLERFQPPMGGTWDDFDDVIGDQVP